MFLITVAELYGTRQSSTPLGALPVVTVAVTRNATSHLRSYLPDTDCISFMSYDIL